MRYNDNESINKINKYINYKYTHRPTIKSLEHNHPIRTI